jgi:hypothetical protein
MVGFITGFASLVYIKNKEGTIENPVVPTQEGTDFKNT